MVMFGHAKYSAENKGYKEKIKLRVDTDFRENWENKLIKQMENRQVSLSLFLYIHIDHNKSYHQFHVLLATDFSFLLLTAMLWLMAD